MRLLYTGILSLVALAAAPLLANAGLAEACAGAGVWAMVVDCRHRACPPSERHEPVRGPL